MTVVAFALGIIVGVSVSMLFVLAAFAGYQAGKEMGELDR